MNDELRRRLGDQRADALVTVLMIINVGGAATDVAGGEWVVGIRILGALCVGYLWCGTWPRWRMRR